MLECGDMQGLQSDVAPRLLDMQPAVLKPRILKAPSIKHILGSSEDVPHGAQRHEVTKVRCLRDACVSGPGMCWAVGDV